MDLRGNNPTRPWIDRLIGLNIILSHGKTRGTEYYVNPQIIRNANFTKQPDLKGIEPHRLKELIYEDLCTYPRSSISEINSRIGAEISRYKIREQLRALIKQVRIISEGQRAGTRYSSKK